MYLRYRYHFDQAGVHTDKVAKILAFIKAHPNSADTTRFWAKKSRTRQLMFFLLSFVVKKMAIDDWDLTTGQEKLIYEVYDEEMREEFVEAWKGTNDQDLIWKKEGDVTMKVPEFVTNYEGAVDWAKIVYPPIKE